MPCESYNTTSTPTMGGSPSSWMPSPSSSWKITLGPILGSVVTPAVTSVTGSPEVTVREARHVAGSTSLSLASSLPRSCGEKVSGPPPLPGTNSIT